MQAANKLVVAVLLADRTGIMRDATAAITGLGGNIDGVSQTVVEGYFSIILTASFATPTSPETVHAAMVEAFRAGEASIVVRPFVPVPLEPRLAGGQRYVLVIAGPDRPGILKCATACLAARGINIEDWTCQFEGPQVAYVGQITVPRSEAVGPLQDELRAVLEPLAMRCTVQHENIFRATNEVGPIKSLLKETFDVARG